mgnify:CR=1 FL=1
MGEMTQNKEGWKGKILSGLFWRFLEQISYQGIQLIFSLFLLRILDTEEVGAVSVISIFITIANTFIQSGFSQALMQKKEIKEEDECIKRLFGSSEPIMSSRLQFQDSLLSDKSIEEFLNK